MSDEKVISLGGAKKRRQQQAETNTHSHNEELVYCSFCKRPNTQVVKMVKGPDVNICSECVMIALQYLILEDKMPSAEAQKILDLFWQKI